MFYYCAVELDTFEERYKNLNPEQKKAVDSIEGPVMVIAGPGTGKTEILAARICNILLKTDTQAGNILCLTYTDAGVGAMRKRLVSFMGDEAYKVNIHTFHSLAKRIMDDYPSFFEGQTFNVMDELTRRKLIESLQVQLPLDNPWHTSVLQSETDSFSFYNPIKELEHLFYVLTDNNISTQQIKSKMQTLSDDENYKLAFPEDLYRQKSGDYAAGDIKQSLRDKKNKQWEKLLAASELLSMYNAKKVELGYADFSDLLVWVFDALKAHEELLLMVQERFQYVLVDEFQDTNPLQSEILYKIIGFFEDNPNCFVVGDDDQSIYSFQGAEVGNMLGFYDKYKNNIQLLSLVKNYRSSAHLLDIAGEYIKKNTDRLVGNIPGLSKDLEAMGAYAAQNQTPVFIEYDSAEKQYTAISSHINNLLEEGVKAEEIAVLAHKNFHLSDFANILSVSDIAYELVKPIDILKEQAIKEVLMWLEYFNKESKKPNTAGIELFQLLHTTDMNTIEIQKLFYAWEENKTTAILESLLSEKDQSLDLFKPNFAPLAKTILDLQKNWNSMAAPEFIQKLYADLNFVKRAVNTKNSKHTIQVLYTFLKFITESSKNHPFKTLEFHLDQVKDYINYQIPVPIYPVLKTKETVKLLTLHGSKGLEFEHVFVIHVDEAGFKSSNKGNMGLTPLFNNHLKNSSQIADPNSTSEEIKAEHELRRLWYVALTRAKKGLYLYSSDTKSPFKGKTELTKGMEVKEGVNNPTEFAKTIETLLTHNPSNKVTAEADWIRNKVQHFVFSPSALSIILNCENEFYYSKLLSIPAAGNVYMAHGNAIHKALERLTKKWIQDEEKMPKEEFIRHFKDYWFTQRGLVSEEQYKLKLKEGEEVLSKYFDLRVNEIYEAVNVIPELRIEGEVAGVPFKGFVDKVYFTEIAGNRNHFTITDYKTGNINTAKRKFKVPNNAARNKEHFNIKGYEYWVQTCLYAYILNAQNQTWTLKSIELDPINPSNESLEVLSHAVSKEDLDFMEVLAKRAQERLHAPNFPQGCGKHDCEWCNFTKTYMPAVETEDNS